MTARQIAEYCDQLLEVGRFDDYCPNGLQVDGDQREVKKIATGVSISKELIEKALDLDVQMIMTHHGLFWDKGDKRIHGPIREKLKLLLENGIALASYHLPLDYHPEIGNNVQLAYEFGLSGLRPIAESAGYPKGVMGTPEQSNVEELAKAIEKTLNRKPLVFPNGPERIQKVAVMTGGAQGYFPLAYEAGADVFITGEISEQNYSESKETGVHFIAAGHYATERYGILALGEKIQQKFGCEVEFIEIENPI